MPLSKLLIRKQAQHTRLGYEKRFLSFLSNKDMRFETVTSIILLYNFTLNMETYLELRLIHPCFRSVIDKAILSFQTMQTHTQSYLHEHTQGKPIYRVRWRNFHLNYVKNEHNTDI